MVNPRTAAKQWLRKQENRTELNRKRFFVRNPNEPGLFDKWGTNGNIIRNASKQFQKQEDYRRKITHTNEDGKVRLIDHAVNTNKFTNGL